MVLTRLRIFKMENRKLSILTTDTRNKGNLEVEKLKNTSYFPLFTR